jgi:proline iminopeptidase
MPDVSQVGALTRRGMLATASMWALASCGGGSPRQGRIAVPGGEVAWRRFGRGGDKTPLLLIHGGPGLGGGYMKGLEALGDERPVYIWDQLGCGRSERPEDMSLWTVERYVEELDAVRAALAPGPVHVLGHSWGTTLAMEWLVTRQPTDVASVIFSSPALSTPQWLADMDALIADLSPGSQAAIAEAKRTGDYGSSEFRAVVDGEWLTTYIARTLGPIEMATMMAPLALFDFNTAILEHMWGPSDFIVTGELLTFDRTAELSMLSMPTLFLCGEFDEATPSTVRAQAAMTPDAEVVIIPGSGHLTMIDAPDVSNGAIRDFLNRVDA